MKLRVAKKICWVVFESFQCDERWVFTKTPHWKQSTIEKAIQVCRRHDKIKGRPKHRPMPYIPSDRELEEQGEIFGAIMCNLAEDLGVPTEEVDKVREQIFR